MTMSSDERIAQLQSFKEAVLRWEQTQDPKVRTYINQNKAWVRQEVIEAECYVEVTIGPPPAIGGLVMRNTDPFVNLFNPPYGANLAPLVVDMVDQTIGILRSPPERKVGRADPSVEIQMLRTTHLLQWPLIPWT